MNLFNTIPFQIGINHVLQKHCLIGETNELQRKDLLSELSLMKRLSPHKHVIQLLACITESGIIISYFFSSLPTCSYNSAKVTKLAFALSSRASLHYNRVCNIWRSLGFLKKEARYRRRLLQYWSSAKKKPYFKSIDKICFGHRRRNGLSELS